jgi:cellulose biosynthesis protein BcsQ
MKQLNFIVQAKGGVGKSLLSYLVATAQDSDESTLFVDADSSTKTSSRQLKFLGENRTESLSLLNEKDVLVRDNLISYLESLIDSPFQKIYFDFGAPESEQLPSLIERDLPFKEFTNELNFKVIFHIVIGGGGAYSASVDYLQKMMRALNNDFEVQVWQSITTFNNFQSLAGELKKNCDKLNIMFRPFGDFDPSSNLGSQILDGIRKGYGINDYQTGAKIRLRKELNENFKDEYTKN